MGGHPQKTEKNIYGRSLLFERDKSEFSQGTI